MRVLTVIDGPLVCKIRIVWGTHCTHVYTNVQQRVYCTFLFIHYLLNTVMRKDSLNTLLTRRSVVARDLCEPGPSQDELAQILRVAHRVPDHGKIGPWRFIVFQGPARQHFGDELAKIFVADNPDTTSKCLAFEADRLSRAPVVIAVISSPQEHKVPKWEQELSCGAACQNMLNAAACLGYGAQWLTEWYAYHASVNQLLGLAESERVAGFVYLGSYNDAPSERKRPDLDERVSYWAQES